MAVIWRSQLEELEEHGISKNNDLSLPITSVLNLKNTCKDLHALVRHKSADGRSSTPHSSFHSPSQPSSSFYLPSSRLWPFSSAVPSCHESNLGMKESVKREEVGEGRGWD
ncbi:hypothetical protein SLEP1_g20203 [Rubroshorea leprosula]|uniref:Uncharacterized protein n=1 Tax=Rubroshorea leprosula TaxID=152421 RepID=A0AAV5JCE6_9ROSI|nr:hypothetical protein SLEP1_g20203 [Rubroshorea leprosula]